MEYPDIKLCIGGEWITRPGIEIENPSTTESIGEVPIATRQDMDEAITAATAGFKVWRKTPPAQRSSIMRKAANLLRDRSESIATMLTLEQGKPLSQARAEVLRSCDVIDWDAEEGRRLYGRVVSGEYGTTHEVFREPIGVVASFTPWNFPFGSPARKIAGALGAGCSIILKTAEETPAGAMAIAQAFYDAGLPAGALSVICGVPAEISSYLIAQPSVRLVAFTGSVPVGKQLASMAGQHMKPSIMELGGHSPVIICDSADVEQAAIECVHGKSRNSGQVCTSPTRFYVDESVYGRFVSAFSDAALSIKLGDGFEEDAQMGPLANIRRIEAMERLVEDGISRGARITAGGRRLDRAGYYYPITALTDIPDDAKAMSEEPFGPLALIAPFENLDEAIKKANALPYGLTAYAYTKSTTDVNHLSCELECGALGINQLVASVIETAFGGVKDSGFGREGGVEGLTHYTTSKTVSHKVRSKG